MSAEYIKAMKTSLRLDAPLHAAITQDAQTENREFSEHVQRILIHYAIGKGLLTQEQIDDYELLWRLVDEAVRMARKICCDGGFGPDITYRTIRACMENESWAAAYEKYVRDNPYKNGNPRKGPINKELGFRIKESIGGTAVMTSKNRPAKVSVSDSIIQSYTLLEKHNEAMVL